MKIVCVPYAGGSSSSFFKWKKYASPEIEIVAPELAGRGARSGEEFYASIQSAAEDIYPVIREKCRGDEFALFGHSMGCFIAYELYGMICKDALMKKNLTHIFMSGNYAPHLNADPDHKTEYYKLDLDGFRKELERIGGTAGEIFDNPLIANYFYPIIRSDYYISETYRMKEFRKFCCGCTVLNGRDDELSASDLESWERYSPRGFEIKNFPGNHFFINDNCGMVVGYINAVLEKHIRREQVAI